MSRTLRSIALAVVSSVLSVGWSVPLAAQSVEGAIYDPVSGATLAGARVNLRFDSGEPGAPGELVPAASLGDGEQGQQTAGDGRYRFDLSRLPAQSRVQLEVDPGSLNYSFPSSRQLPREETAPSGEVVTNASPGADGEGQARLYYLRLEPSGSDYAVSNNHIPLDAVRDVVEVKMTASRRRAEVGDVVTFSLAIINRSRRDFADAGGRSTFVRVVPARGLDLIASSAAISIEGGERASLSPEGRGDGRRLIRLGPLSLAAGARATVEFRAIVGADTRPGRTETEATLVDGGGVVVSNAARSNVVIARGRGIESSTVIGRVFCDTDGDGSVDRGERGVFGAKVFIDSGSYAISDANGFFHFSRVAEGTRLVKLDKQSLLGDSVLGAEKHLLRLSPGLPGKANFPLECARERISGTNPLVALSHATRPLSPADPSLDETLSKRMVIVGDVLLLDVEIDGKKIGLPSALARLEAPPAIRLPGSGGINLKAAPVGGYGVDRPRFVLDFNRPAGIVATRWTFVVSRLSSGATRGPPFFTISGVGHPPAALEWDGRGTDGAVAASGQVFVAQLIVIGSRAKVEAASPLVAFGVGVGQRSRGPTARVWRGSLFSPSASGPVASAALKKLTTELVADLAAGDRIEVAVHSGTIRSRIEALATTQQRANRVKDALVAAGVKENQIIARGRGAAEPVASGQGASSKNRRVELTIVRSAAASGNGSVPTAASIAASALIDGQPVALDSGGFRWEGALPARGAVLIDVQARDGRRAAIDVSLAKERSGANKRVRTVSIAANLKAAEIRVAGATLDSRLLELDLLVVSSGGATRIEPVVPGGVADSRAQLVFTEPSGAVSRVALSNSLRPVNAPAGFSAQSVVQLELLNDDGSRGYSPKRTIGDGRAVAATGADALTVNGAPWKVVDARVKGELEVAPEGVVLIDAARSNGQRAVYLLRLDTVAGVRQSKSEKIERASASAVTRAELLASAAADFWIEVPRAGAALAARVPLHGRARPGNRIIVNGESLTVGPDGAFSTFVELPIDQSELKVASVDSAGYRAELRWPVRTRRSSMFRLGLGEMIVATSATDRGLLGDTAYLPGMSPDSTWAAGPLLISGRANLYLKGELRPSRGFKRVSFTVHLDTSRRRDGAAFFEDVFNPVRDQPVFGDAAIEARDANGRGKLVARLKADDSEAVIGSLVAELGSGRLFRYGRTLDGAGVTLSRELGRSRLGLDAFGSTQSTESGRDHVVFRATGGTLYYLRFSDVVEGSELLTAVVRDRDSGLVTSERILRRNVDYSIDYLSGRVWLMDPIASYQRSNRILTNSDASLTPESGNPAYIEVRYEHRDPRGSRERAAGVEARYGIAGLVVSAGAAGEWREGPQEDYVLWGARAHYAAGKRSHVTLEVAGSKRGEGGSQISVDGGLTFRDLRWSDSAENPSQKRGLGWLLGARVAGDDVSSRLEGTTVELYAQDIGREFSASASQLERGRFKFGGSIVKTLGGRDEVSIRHQADVAQVPRIGPTEDDVTADVGVLDERATFMTTIGWVGRRGRATHRLEAAHHRLSSTAARAGGTATVDARRVGVGGRSSLTLNSRLTVSATQDIWRGIRERDPLLMPIDPQGTGTREDNALAGISSGVGVDWQLVPDAQLSTELRQRWNGDQAASVGLRVKLSEAGSFYVREQAVRDESGPATVTVVGADDRFGPNGRGRSYGEYQLANTGRGARNRAVLGLGQRWNPTPAIGVGLGFEHQQVFGGFLPDGTAVGNNQRDLVRGSLDIKLASTLRAALRLELRADRRESTGESVNELIDADPRDPTGTGFADHGGVAPGAPLVLLEGETTQLVTHLGVSWRPEEGVSFFARARGARTWSAGQIGFTELTGGLAYRSLLDDRLAMLLRYTFLRERRPEARALERDDAHIVALVPVFDWGRRWRLSGKLALKQNTVSGGIAGDVGSTALLGVARIGYRIHGNWDATVEGRGLSLLGDGQRREDKLGSLLELGYYFNRFLRFGLGYNFSHFSDQELGDLTRDAHGFFIRLTAEM